MQDVTPDSVNSLEIIQAQLELTMPTPLRPWANANTLLGLRASPSWPTSAST